MNGLLVPWPVIVALVVVATILVGHRVSLVWKNQIATSIVGSTSIGVGVASAMFLGISLDSRANEDAEKPAAASTSINAAPVPAPVLTTIPIESEAAVAAKDSDAKAVDSPSAPSRTPTSVSAHELHARAEAELNTPIVTESFVKVNRAQRPAWVESEANFTGNVQTIAVASGPWVTQRECQRVLDEEIKKATDEFINRYLGSKHASQLVNYDLKTIRERLIRNDHQFHETITVSFGDMRQSHVLLEFSEDFRRELDERWRQLKAASRLGQTGLTFGGVLALLGALFGFLKVDTATHGAYTGRLQFGVALTILSVVAVGSLVVVKMFPWL